jgi:uncharacterized membrane protein YhiD involved in acid resistance
VGLACGGGLYFVASFSTAMNLVLLRFGPRLTESLEESYESASDMSDMEAMATGDYDKKVLSFPPRNLDYGGTNDEKSPLRPSMDLSEFNKKMASSRLSARSRPSLGI